MDQFQDSQLNYLSMSSDEWIDDVNRSYLIYQGLQVLIIFIK
jgi:hypothetical protein